MNASTISTIRAAADAGLRRLLTRRAALVAAAGLAFAAAAWLNWPWLVAVGAAPLIVSALPCVAMCALGLCMTGKRSCAKEGAAEPPERREGGATGLVRTSRGRTAPRRTPTSAIEGEA